MTSSKPFTASDGYTYASIADRLLGKPEKTTRNGNISAYRISGYGEDAICAYRKAFDEVCPEGDPGPSRIFGEAHQAGIDAAYATGRFGPRHTWKR